MPSLSDVQVKAIIFNAVGRSSETASIPFTRLFVSTGNSGYSIGALQTDFGQNKSKGRDLIAAYQSSASQDQRLSSAEETAAKDIITRSGLGKSGTQLDPTVEFKLNRFLASPAGIAWVEARDEETSTLCRPRVQRPHNEAMGAASRCAAEVSAERTPGESAWRRMGRTIPELTEEGRLRHPVLVRPRGDIGSP